MKKLCSRWTTTDRVTWCNAMLTRFKKGASNLVCDIVTAKLGNVMGSGFSYANTELYSPATCLFQIKWLEPEGFSAGPVWVGR
ncbi:hypothetical protein EVAR_26824_1 [Eumeta japonica]|uniref:Uncharacterized protein n=1 Tax=Eumeta variegata TaxID=151549 RepID=A0A4C1WG65_EUMVA|nr:hypothetical protein EVAR_26824_1 [Eumeta japonica]